MRSIRRRDLLILCLSSGVAVSAHADTVDRIAAIVNDDVITEADITSHVAALLDEEEGPAPDAPRPEAQQMRETVLHRLIDERLILQEAKRTGQTVTNDDVERELDQVAQRAGSQEAFEQSLRQSGIPRERLKERIREQLLAQRAIDAKVRGTITISPQEVATELAAHPPPAAGGGGQIHARHLLIRVSERRSEDDARRLAEELAGRLARGEEFAALAKQYSEDGSAQDGGDMGWVGQGTLMPELDAALFLLQPGQVSPPVKTALGYHLLKADARGAPGATETDRAKAMATQAIYRRKFHEAMQRWVEELRRQAYIEIPPTSSGS